MTPPYIFYLWFSSEVFSGTNESTATYAELIVGIVTVLVGGATVDLVDDPDSLGGLPAVG